METMTKNEFETELVSLRKQYLKELIDGDLDKKEGIDKFIYHIIQYVKTNKSSKEFIDSKFLLDYLKDNFSNEIMSFTDNLDLYYEQVYKMLSSWKSKDDMIQEYKDKYIKTYADLENSKKEFSNYQKRVYLEKQQMVTDTKWKLLSDITSIIEDFDRAKSNNDMSGVELIYTKFDSFLTKNGVSKFIPSKGDQFNPDNMECIVTIDNPEFSGKVFDVVKNGWIVNEKISQYPQVVVGK